MTKAGEIVKWSERKGPAPRHNRPGHKVFVHVGRNSMGGGPKVTLRQPKQKGTTKVC